MIIETSAATFGKNFDVMLGHVQQRHSIVIHNDGKPLAALVDSRLFASIRRMQERFDVLCNRIEAGFAETSEADGLAEIEAAVMKERAKPRTAKKPTSKAKR